MHAIIIEPIIHPTLCPFLLMFYGKPKHAFGGLRSDEHTASKTSSAF